MFFLNLVLSMSILVVLFHSISINVERSLSCRILISIVEIDRTIVLFVLSISITNNVVILSDTDIDICFILSLFMSKDHNHIAC